MRLIITLLIFSSMACSSIKNPVNQVDDDVYSKRKESNTKPKSIDEVEPWNKKRGPQAQSTPHHHLGYGMHYEPLDSPETAEEKARAEEAMRIWNQRRNPELAKMNGQEESNLLVSGDAPNADDWRNGTARNSYYADPYFDILSQNWGWTSLFNPIIFRPGCYPFAPGYNVGLGWNSMYGWNAGFGMGWGNMGMGWGNMSMGWGMGYPMYGYNPYAWDPFWPYPMYGYNPYYNPYFGFGWNNWGWNSFYGYGWGPRCNRRWGNDIVANRSYMRPMNSLGGSMPSGSSKPATVSRPGGGSTRPVASPTPRPSTAPAYSNKPGGDLVMDERGRPQYVPPRRSRVTPESGVSSPGRDNGFDPSPTIRPSLRPSSPSSGSRPDIEPERNNRPAPSFDGPSRPAPSRPSLSSQPSYSRPSTPQSAPSISRPSAPSSRPSAPSSGGATSNPGGSFRGRP